MKNKILLGAGIGISACAIALAAKDPVVMTVNGVDVPRSEFEYLYHKNSQQQQLEAQPIEEYAEMFKLYKLKVADAKAQGIDTTAAFRREMEQYRADLAAPYVTDSAYIMELVDEAFARSREEVETSHIMLLKKRKASENAAVRSRLDSIRSLALAGEDFGELAGRFSEDRPSAPRGGSLGYIAGGRYPYFFEQAAYSLQPGEVSGIVESPMAYHIIKAGARRPAQGQVLVSHIMKMARPEASEADAARAKQQIDSIYQVVKQDPSKFEQLARTLSDDPGSARNGGALPWFGTGQMVPEFEEVSYALAPGEISEPVKSMFGWHIIQKKDFRPAPSYEEMVPELKQRVVNPRDERALLVKKRTTANLERKHKGRRNQKVVDSMLAYVEANGIDSTFYADALGGKLGSEAFAYIGKSPVTVARLASTMNHLTVPAGIDGVSALNGRMDHVYADALMEAEEQWLEDNVADYRNLLHEYRDGSLLYEASLRRVWDKAAKDTEGLNAYFEAHRGDYIWNEPKAKGILVQAANDSVAQLVRDRALTLGGDTIVQTIRKEFRQNATADRVLASKGVNAMVDNLMFGSPAVQPSNSAYTVYFMLNPAVISAPEEMSDVRGLVVNDYQNQLEREWAEELRALYPVTVNEKELRKIK